MQYWDNITITPPRSTWFFRHDFSFHYIIQNITSRLDKRLLQIRRHTFLTYYSKLHYSRHSISASATNQTLAAHYVISWQEGKLCYIDRWIDSITINFHSLWLLPIARLIALIYKNTIEAATPKVLLIVCSLQHFVVYCCLFSYCFCLIMLTKIIINLYFSTNWWSTKRRWLVLSWPIASNTFIS